MRIPSQFNDDNLYRGGKRPASHSGASYRRLFRLLIALVLVVLVMRESARPGLYRTFFGDPMPLYTTKPAPDATEAGRDTFVRGGSSQPTEGDEDFGNTKLADPSRADELMSSVVDGSVWRSEDADALYFLLATADEVDPSEAVRVAVLPLLQQPEVYRGRPVRFRGTVVRSESVDASENEFGIEKYWHLWLRPAAGGDRPLLAVVKHLPVKLESIDGPGEATTELVEVQVVGRFFKRLAYRSSIGADLAPVVVGIAIVENDEVRRAEPTDVKQDLSEPRLMLGILLAITIGLGLAAITMWRTTVTARRVRRLRQSTSDRSATFLQVLGDREDGGQESRERNEP